MRAKDMHPLCCISIDCPGSGGGGIGDRSLSPSDRDRMDGDDEPNVGSEEGSVGLVAVAGVLYKWTNYGKGWKSRWFSLKNGVLSYSKVRISTEDDEDDVKLIGESRIGGRGRRKQGKNDVGGGVVHLKVSSFRESRSDGRRFYIFSTTKTLHLKSASRKDRVAWIEALLSARCKYPPKPLNIPISFIHNDASFSTERLRKRLLDEGLGENLVRDCEQLMLSEISQLKLLYEERLSMLALGQLEEVSIDAETDGIQNTQLLLKNRFSSSGHGKYSEYSTTESSDDVEKQELDELSEEDGPSFFDTNESFIFDSSISCDPVGSVVHSNGRENHSSNLEAMDAGTEFVNHKFPKVERRKRLPTPLEKEKAVSLWSMIKDNAGKDLTRVCLPVYFNEPLSSLQKCFEDLEYSHLLDQAYEHGKKGNSLMRILNVAAFAVSGYASSEGRPCKPFNPLLGETYEANFPEKGIRFFSEKVSHHPMLIACHCEGRGWKFWGDSNLKSKFWGRSIQLDPVGTLTLEFDDGEIFQWSKVTTSIYNLILGKVYCDHHGTMRITGNREYSCTLKFKEQSILDRNPHQVHGFVEDVKGTKVSTLMGKWDYSIYCIEGYDTSWKFPYIIKNGSLLWRKNDPPVNPTRYNLSSFAITLNELTSDLEEKLPPTDSRRRPDQRHLENGEYEKANAEKLRLEQRQRVSRKLQENGWKPRWFHRETEEDTFRYVGGYWEAREQKIWDECPSIFGDLSKDTDMCSFK